MANQTTTTFKADISNLRAGIQQASREIRLANAEFKAASAGMDDWSKSADGLNAKINQTQKVLKSQKSILESYEKELELVTKEYGENSKAAQEMQIKVENQKAKVTQTEKALEDYTNALENLDEENAQVAKSTETANEGFTVAKGVLADLVSSGIKLAINALKDLAKEAIQVGASFESEMSKVAAISGANADEIEQLTDKAKELGESTVFSASESASAFEYMAMAGWKTEDMLEGIEGIMNLAAASGSDLATTSDIVTDALTAMGYEAKDASRLADVMAAASSNANTNVELMGSTFQYAAPLVGALGYSMEDTAVAIGLMANAGIKGDKAGTALRSTLSRLSAPPKECAEALDNLGVSLTDEAGNMKSLDEVMQDLRKAFANLDETEKTANAKAIAGQEAMSGLLAIVSASTEDYDKLTDAIANSTGAAASMADTMNDNVNGVLTLLKSKVEGIMIKLFDEASDSMKRGINEVGDALDLIDWDKVGDAIGEFAEDAADLFAYIVKNGNTVISIIKTLGKVIALAFVANKVGAFAGVLNGMIKTMTSLATATTAAETAQLGLNAAQLATPVGALVGVTTALVALYVKGRAEAKEFAEAEHGLTDEEKDLNREIDELADKTKELKDAREESIKETTGEFNYIKQLKEEYNGLIDSNGKVKEGYEDRANFILNELSNALGIEMENLQAEIDQNGKLGESIDQLIQKKQAEATLSAYEDSYKEAKANEATALEDAIKAQNNYSDAVKDYNGLLEKEQELKQKIKELGDSGKAADSVVYQQQLLSLSDSLSAAKTRVDENKEALEQANQAYKDGQQVIKDYEGLSSAIVSGDVTKINEELEKLTTGFKDAKSSTEKELEEQVQSLQDHYNELKNAAENGSELVTEEMLQGAQEMVDKAQAELDKFPGQASKSAQTAVQGYADTFGNGSPEAERAANKVRQAVYDGTDNPQTQATGKLAIDEYNSGIESELTQSNTAGKNMAEQAKAGAESVDATQSGEYFAEGYSNGIGNWISNVFQKAKALAQSAWSGLKEGQQEGSPSKLTTQSGIYFAQGFENGITEGTAAVVKAAYKMAQKAVSDGLYSGLIGTKSVISKNLGTLLSEMLTETKDLSTIGTTTSTGFADALSAKLDYEYNKISYLNEQKSKALQKEIDSVKKQEESALSDLKTENTKRLADLKTWYEDETETLEAQIKEIESISESKRTAAQKKELKRLKNQLEKTKAQYEKLVEEAEEDYSTMADSIESAYEKQIEKMESSKEAFESASQEMLSELSSAMSEYATKAQELIDSTMNSISSDYSSQYNALINKQDSLIEKLKSAGDLFSISNANVMTLNDIQAQTQAIKEYASKLQTIKEKVSSELFDEIASYDMEEGSAFIDRLLAMDDKELQAYSDAFTEKMNLAEALGESIYSSDMSKLSSDYADAIKNAFADLPSALEELGEQTIAGFISGLTSNTDYMESAIRSYISSMIAEFKEDLGIHSPSKVMAEIGEYTGQGFTNGLLSMIKTVKAAAEELVDTVSSSLDFSDSISLAKLNASQSAAGTSSTSNVSNQSQTIVFNQTNNSPKALDSLQIYRNTNTLLFNAKVGLSNV